MSVDKQSNGSTALVLTTINAPEVTTIERWLGVTAFDHVIVIGDEKTNDNAWLDYAKTQPRLLYSSLFDQDSRFPEASASIPRNHYARKSLGYLIAYELGCDFLFETDDDNAPKGSFKTFLDYGRTFLRETNPIREVAVSGGEWLNIFSMMGQPQIWPRGFPIGALLLGRGTIGPAVSRLHYGAIQFMCDGDPDYDAVGRTCFTGAGLKDEYDEDAGINLQFNRSPLPHAIAPNTWSPWNTQSTLLDLRHDSLMSAWRIPVTTTFRACDIVRGYVALKCMWNENKTLGYAGAAVHQSRNPHDLAMDMRSELGLYHAAPLVPGMTKGCHRVEQCLEAMWRLGLLKDLSAELNASREFTSAIYKIRAARK